MCVYYLFINLIYVANRILPAWSTIRASAAHFPMFPLHYAYSCVWCFPIVPVNVRSVEWRYGEEQIATTDERLSIPALERLSVENDLLAIYMYILVALLTHLELQTAESICKTIAAINVFE